MARTRGVPQLTVVRPLEPVHGPVDRMVLMMLRSRTTVRAVWLLKIVANLAFGVICLFTDDVRPVWLNSSMFLAAATLNIVVFARPRRSRLVGAALALSIGACLLRAGTIVLASAADDLHLPPARIVMSVAVWVTLAAFGTVMTIGASAGLGGKQRDRGSG